MPTERFGIWVLFFLLVFLPMLGPTSLVAQTKAGEDGGELPDGTQYLMKVPANWNGTLIRDLDYASGANAPRWGPCSRRVTPSLAPDGIGCGCISTIRSAKSPTSISSSRCSTSASAGPSA
jgi:hypothetical protein